jgi:hypothetical protein
LVLGGVTQAALAVQLITQGGGVDLRYTPPSSLSVSSYIDPTTVFHVLGVAICLKYYLTRSALVFTKRRYPMSRGTSGATMSTSGAMSLSLDMSSADKDSHSDSKLSPAQLMVVYLDVVGLGLLQSMFFLVLVGGEVGGGGISHTCFVVAIVGIVVSAAPLVASYHLTARLLKGGRDSGNFRAICTQVTDERDLARGLKMPYAQRAIAWTNTWLQVFFFHSLSFLPAYEWTPTELKHMASPVSFQDHLFVSRVRCLYVSENMHVCV